MSPPRTTASHAGKLDEISERIGELGAYVHEHRHGVNNLGMKFDALSLDLAKRVEALDVKIASRIDEMNASLSRRLDSLEQRIDALESVNDKRSGALGLFEWVVRNWPAVVGYFAIVAVILKATGKI